MNAYSVTVSYGLTGTSEVRGRERLPMRSFIDWLSKFYGAGRNPYLRLSQAERDKLDMRAMVFFSLAAACLAIWFFLQS
jgi:hypothetical protein